MSEARRRILVIGSQYPPHILGGYELLCESHVAWLRRQGTAVHVLTTTYGGTPRRETTEVGPHGEVITRALDFHWEDFEHRRPNGVALWEGERRQRQVLERILDGERFDAVQVWQMACVSKSLLTVLTERGLPVIAVVAEHWPLWDIDTDHWVRLWRHRPLAPLRGAADRVIAPTEVTSAMAAIRPLYLSDYMRTRTEQDLEVWRGRGTVAHAGIELDRFPPPRASDAPLHDPLRLLYLGRVEPRKGVHTAIEALGRLNRAGVAATLGIVGWVGDDYRAELQELARTEEVITDVSWVGPTSPEEVPGAMAEYDIVVFPTLWDEPFGLVPLEAMMTGCLVVATGTGGSAEFLTDGESALRFPPGDADALAAAVLRLRDDPALVRHLREGGLATARAHDINRWHEALDAWSREVESQAKSAVVM